MFEHCGADEQAQMGFSAPRNSEDHRRKQRPALSLWCGEVYDAADQPAMQRVVKPGFEVIELPDADLQKLNTLTIPQRKKWVKEMQAKGFDCEAVLKTALQYLNEKLFTPFALNLNRRS
jgi:hypothetical protein